METERSSNKVSVTTGCVANPSEGIVVSSMKTRWITNANAVWTNATLQPNLDTAGEATLETEINKRSTQKEKLKKKTQFLIKTNNATMCVITGRGREQQSMVLVFKSKNELVSKLLHR